MWPYTKLILASLNFTLKGEGFKAPPSNKAQFYRVEVSVIKTVSRPCPGSLTQSPLLPTLRLRPCLWPHRTLEGFMLINSHNLQQSWAADIALAVLLLQLGAISALHS